MRMTAPSPAFSSHSSCFIHGDPGHVGISPHDHPLTPTGEQRKFIAGFCCQGGNVPKVDVLLSYCCPAVIKWQLVHHALLPVVQRTIKMCHGVVIPLARVSLFDRALYNVHALITPHSYCTTSAVTRQRLSRRRLRLLRPLRLYRPIFAFPPALAAVRLAEAVQATVGALQPGLRPVQRGLVAPRP